MLQRFHQKSSSSESENCLLKEHSIALETLCNKMQYIICNKNLSVLCINVYSIIKHENKMEMIKFAKMYFFFYRFSFEVQLFLFRLSMKQFYVYKNNFSVLL